MLKPVSMESEAELSLFVLEFGSWVNVSQRFHYTNLQPMWGPDNLSKSDYHDEASFPYVWMRRRVVGKIGFCES